jgi:ABC-2 type transport system permease protein
MPLLKPYFHTMLMEAKAPMDGGILYFLSGYFVRLLRMLLLLGIWRSIFSSNTQFSPEQAGIILQYTFLASAFYQQLDVQTTASVTLWEGTVASRYLRPLNIFGQYIAETAGRWLPGLIFFTLPVLLASPLLGISLRPQNPMLPLVFLVSLLLGIVTGFAMDFIFTGFMVWMGNMHYFAYVIRTAVTVLLSGALIPLQVLPWGMGTVLEWLPFASMASAPLQIYTGSQEVVRLLVLQAGWCIVLWITAVMLWRKNRQRLVIFGG